MTRRSKPSICRALWLGLMPYSLGAALAACGRTDTDSLLLAPSAGGGRAQPGSGGAVTGGGPAPAGRGGTSIGGTGGGTDCGALIDDLEDGDGYICRGNGRSGAWYAYNDGTGTQWPFPRVSWAPIETSDTDGRDSSLRAMRTYGDGFTAWGAGVGVDLAFDGETYGTYDASQYDGIRFFARTPAGPFAIDVRVGTYSTVSAERGGVCGSDPCSPGSWSTTLAPGWNEFEVPFSVLAPAAGALEQGALSNIEFQAPGLEPFDFWIDDLWFYSGEPACCARMPPRCRRGVELRDPELAALLGSGPLPCEEVCTRTTLEGRANNPPIQDLEGLECFTGLVAVDLSYESIEDLAPLSGLTRLARLVLGANPITDLSPLTGLTQLHSLDLSDNPIGDATSLTSLTELRDLDLSGAQLTTTAGVDRLPQLTTLDLSENHLTSAPLHGLASLETLDLSGNQLVDVAGLASLTTLVDLDVSRNAIVRADELAELRGLASLDIADNGLTDIAFIGDLPELRSLSLTGNQVRDLTPVAALGVLESLHAANNQITDIWPLFDLPHLTDVELAGNGITDLTPLQSLESLTTLRLARNQISDVRPLGSLTQLTNLELSGNQLADVFALAELTHLELLTLTDNQITDLSQFIGFGGLRPGEGETAMLYLDGNPIDCVAQANVLEVLRARGLTVIVDCY